MKSMFVFSFWLLSMPVSAQMLGSMECIPAASSVEGDEFFAANASIEFSVKKNPMTEELEQVFQRQVFGPKDFPDSGLEEGWIELSLLGWSSLLSEKKEHLTLMLKHLSSDGSELYAESWQMFHYEKASIFMMKSTSSKVMQVGAYCAFKSAKAN